MKVYIITYESFPNGMAATGRIKCYTKAIRSRGIHCQVIVAKRTEIYGVKPKNTIAKDLRCEHPYFYIGGTPLRESNVLMRQINDLKDRKSLNKYLNRNLKKGDIILTYMQEKPICSSILKSAKRKEAIVIRDLCEFPYGTGKETPKTVAKRKRYMKEVFPQYDGAICISQALYDYAEKYKGPAAKLVKVPIMIDEDQWNFSNVSGNPSDIPYLFHSGALHQQKDGILDTLEAFGKAAKRVPFEIKYYFTGNIERSPDAKGIKRLITEYSLENRVEFLGFISNSELKSYIKNAGGFIINKSDNQQNRFCFATKLGEYLLSENTVITTNVGEAKFYLENGESAILIEPGNVEALAKEIEYLFINGIDKSIGKQGREVALNNFTLKRQGVLLEEYFNDL